MSVILSNRSLSSLCIKLYKFQPMLKNINYTASEASLKLSFNSDAYNLCNIRDYSNLTFNHALKEKGITITEKLLKNKELDPVVKQLLEGLFKGKRAALAESITLVESSSVRKKLQAKQLLYHVLQFMKLKNKQLKTENLSFRIGLSGPPGAGKSTFIEKFGKSLTGMNMKLAVLAVDPSSATTGGSILGDKTRMPELSKDMNAYIRPSPNRGHLGGVTRSTNEAIVLCEAAGYDVIIVETVGVGQSEYSVADMVDLFALLLPPGAGDELQGIKKGIMELSDVIIVNKSDGDLVNAAMRVQYEYISALKYMQPKSQHWKPVVKRVSSITNEGIDELWEIMQSFKKKMSGLGELKRKREQQQKSWMWTHLKDNLVTRFIEIPAIKSKIREYEVQVMKGIISPGEAADYILENIVEEIHKGRI